MTMYMYSIRKRLYATINILIGKLFTNTMLRIYKLYKM